MKHLICNTCIAEHKKKPGTRLVYTASEFGEPAEYERITFGTARHPTVEQRTVFINGVAEPPMDLAYYNCDSCGAEIGPGEECATWTAWTEREPVPELWELMYLELKP